MKIDELIELLQLKPHPEGGFFRETFRSPESVAGTALDSRFAGDRACSTAIYYLLTPGNFSALHRLQVDEVYHFYLGGPIDMLMLGPGGEVRRLRLGQNIVAGEHLQIVVPHLWWQGSRLAAGGQFALVGCTLAPGFEFSDFELGRRQQLQSVYPDARDEIAALSRA